MRTPMTLCLLLDPRENRIFLGMKKKGLGAGRWNGFGGKVEMRESIENAVKREVLEESGVEVLRIEKMGQIDFEFAAKPGDFLEVHIYKGEGWKGELKESNEMVPRWWPIDDIPLAQMWPDDRYWIPLFLAGKKFTGRFLFGPHDSVLEYSLKIVA
jgi:8-oxo-dGTP diphosphatase/2-hydroxy-dATP diphosphatase